MAEITTVLILTLFPAAMIAAAISDLFTMTISNKVSLALMAGFFVVAAFSGMDLGAIGMHLLAGLAMLALSFSLFAMGWIGGGDAKLFAVTAIWMGWSVQLVDYTLMIGFVGGLLTVLLLLLRRIPMPGVLTKLRWFARLHAIEDGIPYGIALAVGGLIVYPNTFIFSLISS